MVRLYDSLVLSFVGASMGQTCVPHEVLTCINDKSTMYPRCDPTQKKPQALCEKEPNAEMWPADPANKIEAKHCNDFEFGTYCTEKWANALNEMLSSREVDICGDEDKIARLLAQVTYETGYFSTLGQPEDQGVGLIHMLPMNFPQNAKDMDRVWGADNGYAEKVAAEGATFFTESPENAWRSLAAFYIGGSTVPSCYGKNMFDMELEDQTTCIFGSSVDRSHELKVVQDCMAKPPSKSKSPSPPPVPIDPKCKVCSTFCDPCRACVDVKDGESCSKCWRCHDYGKDKAKDEDDHCHALDKKHKWREGKVQCLSEDRPDCQSECWGTTEVSV